jgi:hypothetical protein
LNAVIIVNPAVDCLYEATAFGTTSVIIFWPL